MASSLSSSDDESRFIRVGASGELFLRGMVRNFPRIDFLGGGEAKLVSSVGADGTWKSKVGSSALLACDGSGIDVAIGVVSDESDVSRLISDSISECAMIYLNVLISSSMGSLKDTRFDASSGLASFDIRTWYDRCAILVTSIDVTPCGWKYDSLVCCSEKAVEADETEELLGVLELPWSDGVPKSCS
jgi:hypothetical protein